MSIVVDPANPPEAESAKIPLTPLVLDEIQKLPLRELIRLNDEAGLRIRTDCTRRHLVFDRARHNLHAAASSPAPACWNAIRTTGTSAGPPTTFVQAPTMF
jgi:hypothetical protein